MNNRVTINEAQLHEIIANSINKILNEAFQSNKLKQFSKEHGGLTNGKWSSDFRNDLYNMNDDDFNKYTPVDQEEHYKRYGINGWDRKSNFNNDHFQPIEFNDGTFMVRKDPESAYHSERSENLSNTRNNRREAQKNDGTEDYQYENPYLNDIINDKFADVRKSWGMKAEPKNYKKGQLNPYAIKHKHIVDTYRGKEQNKNLDDLNNGNFKEDPNDKRSLINKAKNSRKHD